MQTVNIHEAKTHLSKLVEKAANGEPFIIAKAGKPMVKVVSLDTTEPETTRRIGFGDGKSRIPDDIKTIFNDEIEEMFYGKS